MDRSPLWTGLSLSVHFAEVLHKEYWLLTCPTQQWICIHKRAGRQTILVWQHTKCRGCCNPWSAMLRFFIHEVKGTYIYYVYTYNHGTCTPVSLECVTPTIPNLSDLSMHMKVTSTYTLYGMAHEDNANINSMSTLHSSPFLTNPACKHHLSIQSQTETPQTVQHETHPPW